jgi:hypothetical protein
VWDDLLATNQEQQVDVLSPRGIRDANQQNISPQPVFAHPCVTPKKMLSSGKSPRCSQAGYRATPVWPTSARFSCGTSTSSLACSTSVLRRSISEKKTAPTCLQITRSASFTYRGHSGETHSTHRSTPRCRLRHPRPTKSFSITRLQCRRSGIPRSSRLCYLAPSVRELRQG